MGSQITADAQHFIQSLLKANPDERQSVDALLTHPWLRNAMPPRANLGQPVLTTGALAVAQVLSNLEQFSHAPDFFSVCVASAARQLDYHSLREIHAVFCQLDLNGDGFLDISELRSGFELVFGTDSKEALEVDDIFSRLDLAGNGVITYTEFCAAGLGERMFSEEHVLWASFKPFDLNDNGCISHAEICQVLSRADVNHVWSEEVCEEVANAFMGELGSHDGNINFSDWLELMRGCALRHRTQAPRRTSQTESDCLKYISQFMREAGKSSTPDNNEEASANEEEASCTPDHNLEAPSRVQNAMPTKPSMKVLGRLCASDSRCVLQ